MEFANIIYTVEGGIATIKLNRPKALNALNSEINRDIMDAINLVKADSSVRVLIMTGSERAFAAGADVKEMAEANPRYAREFCGLAIEINNILESLPIPTIAAVGGFAFGGGCEMTVPAPPCPSPRWVWASTPAPTAAPAPPLSSAPPRPSSWSCSPR